MVLKLLDLNGQLKEKPKRIVINTTPIHEQHDFFTLNNIGTAYCGYRVQ